MPLSQNESTCGTIHMKMCFTRTSIFMQIKVIFIWMVLHEVKTRFKTEAKDNTEMAYSTSRRSRSIHSNVHKEVAPPFSLLLLRWKGLPYSMEILQELFFADWRISVHCVNIFFCGSRWLKCLLRTIFLPFSVQLAEYDVIFLTFIACWVTANSTC